MSDILVSCGPTRSDRGGSSGLPRALGPSRSASTPVLPPDALRALAHEFLALTSADTASVTINHQAIGMARIAMGRVRMQDNGDEIELSLMTQFGRRAQVWLNVNQIDSASLRRAVEYLDRTARELPGDPTSLAMPILPRQYRPNTTWRASTAAAFEGARHDAVEQLMGPVLDASIDASAFVGVYARSTAYADKRGVLAVGEETDAELAVTGWTPDGKNSGWAGQASRDWSALVPSAVAARAIEVTRRADNPVAFEPGRYTVILDRCAVAQLVCTMGGAFDARLTLGGFTPLYNPETRRPRLGEQIADARITLSSDPGDLEGGYLPFDANGDPLVPMTWIDHGMLVNLAFRADYAAEMGYARPNDAPRALRLERVTAGGMATADDMIAACRRGIYINRFAYLDGVTGDATPGMLTGVTTGGCFLVRDGRLDKPIRNLRFRESLWDCLRRLEAIGVSARASFGYSPWSGRWPIDPTIVPPLMIRDFNFVALADTV